MNTPVRIVHDTNVLVSALVLSPDRGFRLRQLWQSGRVIPLASQQTTDELVRVLSYEKFALKPTEQQDILMEYSGYWEAVEVSNAPPTPNVRDVEDRPFLELALVGRADALVTGDRDLLNLVLAFSVVILRPQQFREWLRRRGG